MKITKRDGRVVAFDKTKIEKAILGAVADVDGKPDAGAGLAHAIADKIELEATKSKTTLDIEQVQDMVERELMASNRKDVAREYITYRNERTRARERTSELMRQIGEKLNATNVVNQNANVDERSFGGRMGEARAIVVKQYALDNLVSPMAKAHHENNEIYLHDLDSYAVGEHNCARGDSWVEVRDDNGTHVLRLQELANELGVKQNQTADTSCANISILARDGWTHLQSLTRRPTYANEALYEIKTATGMPITLTGEHRMPVIRNDKEVILEVKDLIPGDQLLESMQAIGTTDDPETWLDLSKLTNQDTLDLRIKNARPLNDYLKYRYNVRLSDICPSVAVKPQLNHAQLTVEDFLDVIHRYPIPFELMMRLLVKDNNGKHCCPLLLPISPSLAKLYGYIYCDGGVYQRKEGSQWQLTFTNANPQVMDDFCACYREVFGYAPTVHNPAGNSPCYRITDESRIPCVIFANFANARKINAGNIRLPNFVMNGSNDIKLAYLSAFIDADGCVSSQKISFRTCAKTVAEQLMILLKSMNYHPSMYLISKKGSEYDFGKSNRTGTRNFDDYSVILAKHEDVRRLMQETDALKTADVILRPKTSSSYTPTKITHISKINERCDVYDVQTTSHWFIVNNYVSHNCLTLPIDDLLANGFITRQTDVRPAGSVKSAMQLVAVLFQLQSLCQFGGVAAGHLDWSMVPYVRKSFSKHYRDGMKFIAHDPNYHRDGDKSIVDATYMANRDVYEYAMEMTEEEVRQATEAMFHNLNTLQSRSGDQLPFSSINFGTCTLPEGRMVTKAILETSLDGLGRLHTTPIFPCSIMKLKTGVNRKPGDPNYDLFQLALKSTSQRLYPNYANVDWSGNAGYDPNDPRTEFATMGALAGREHLYIRFDHEQTIHDMSIKDLFLWAKGETITSRPAQIAFTKTSLSLPGKSRYVQDHTQVTARREPGVYAITYIPQDVTYIGSSSSIGQRWNEHRVAIRTTGGPDGGIKFGDPELANYRFEVLEYTKDYQEREHYYIESTPNINVRGTSRKYFKNVTRKHPPIYTRPNFKQDKTIPQTLIDLSDKDVMVLDRDNKWVKVRHIFMNNKRNTPFMMHIRYQELEHERTLSCTEDHPLWTGDDFTEAAKLQPGDHIYRADGLEMTVIETSWHNVPVESYDIGTESGTFIGSDIQMHNCRTANGYDINGFGQLKDGRGNICPVTIILPTIAMYTIEQLQKDGLDLEQAPDDVIIDAFLKVLEPYIEDAKDMLIERFEYIASRSPSSAPFMYQNSTMAGYDGKTVLSAIKHGTLAIGQLAIAEALQILIDCDHTTERGMVAAKRIEQLFADKCKEYKQKYRLNFGVYYTPRIPWAA